MGFLSAIAGPVVGGLFSAFGQKRANDQTGANTQAQMDFQERMSNTSYQRSMADMRAAGLNPMLAYQQGGANSPGGASFTAQNELSSAPETVNSAFTNYQKTQQNKLIRAQTQQVEQQTRTGAATEANVNAQTDKTTAETPNVRAQLPNIEMTGNILRSQWQNLGRDNRRKMLDNLIISLDITSAYAKQRAAKLLEQYLTSKTGSFARLAALLGADTATATSALSNIIRPLRRRPNVAPRRKPLSHGMLTRP